MPVSLVALGQDRPIDNVKGSNERGRAVMHVVMSNDLHAAPWAVKGWAR